MILLLKLFLAHILGDFVFQPGTWITDKETRKIKSRCLYQHGIIHFVLIIFIVQDVHFWKYALLLSLIHLAIDILKVYKQPAALPNVPDKDRQKWFFYDQILHLVTLFLVWHFYENPTMVFTFWDNVPFLICFTGFVFITEPASVLIKFIISPWNTASTSSSSNTRNSLANAGKTIGFIERILTLIMMLNEQWEAIGFLVAAKSVLRIGEVRNNRDKNLTEYILVGTLLSFGIAILTGVILKQLLSLNTH